MPQVPADHDRAPAVPDRNATAVADTAVADALSRIRLDGAIFLRAEYSGSWAYQSLPTDDVIRFLAPGNDRVLLFHVVASHRCWVEVAADERYWADEGDVIVLPYGDLHRMGGGEESPLVNISTFMIPPPWDTMPVLRHGDGGKVTNVVCGYLLSDDPLFDPKLRALPPVFVVSPPDGPARDWVRASIEYAAGQTSIRNRTVVQAPTPIAQLLLIEVLKIHLANSPLRTGWLHAWHDPVVAPALAKIHAMPERKWSVAELAAAANVSVSLLDERFREQLGVAPIRYLTGWRIHLARDLLRSTDLSVSSIARRVGYDSEEAFSRAFKRSHDVPPSQWRRGSSATS